MVDGIVLAGGFSLRAKTNKMVLKYKQKELILHTIETMHKVCKRIILVTGHYHSELVALLANLDYLTIVYNKDYPKGMFSSIKAGVMHVENSFFIIPGDCPLVKEKTYLEILHQKKDIVVPSYNNRLGHPIYFDISYKEKILSTNHNNLKDFRNDYEFNILETEDSGVLKDIDNLKDYENLLGKD